MARTRTLAQAMPVFDAKTEEDFEKYQQAYLLFLKHVNTSGTPREREELRSEIQKSWIKAGIMNKDGKIKKQFENVIVSNEVASND